MKLIRVLLALIMILIFLVPGGARKIGYRHSSKATIEEKEEEMVGGSFMVASECENCNNGYRLDQIQFTGFDKKRSATKESFFITNNTDRTLTSVALYIEYLTPEGDQLHKRYYRLQCNIPAGETRKADIPSWDNQKSFYYIDSETSPRGGNPFRVVFDPIAYYLRF